MASNPFDVFSKSALDMASSIAAKEQVSCLERLFESRFCGVIRLVRVTGVIGVTLEIASK